MNHFNFVVPYRNRPNCLKVFQSKFPAYLRSQAYIDSFNVLIVEQTFEKPFNLAKLINVGFDVFKNKFPYGQEDRFIFFPVDAIPLAGSLEVPAGSAVMFCTKELPEFPKAFGFRNDVFEAINGLSNNYWGWGREDEDLTKMRLKVRNIPTFGTFLECIFMMSHGAEGKAGDLDIKDAGAGKNFEKNTDYAMLMVHEIRDPMVSGLNTLQYKPVDELTMLDELNHMYRVGVSI